MSNSDKITELKKELMAKMIEYYRVRSRISWLKKHPYVKLLPTEKPTDKHLRHIDNEISSIQRQIGEVKGDGCPALHYDIEDIPHRTCLLERRYWITEDDEVSFFAQFCYTCPFNSDEVVAIMAANAFRKGKNEEGDHW